MKDGFVAVISTHFGNLLSLFDLVAFGHQPGAVVSVSAEHTITVLDNDQFAVTDQAVATVDDFTTGCRGDRLPLFSTDINTIPRGIVGLEVADDPPLRRPGPRTRIAARCGRAGGRL